MSHYPQSFNRPAGATLRIVKLIVMRSGTYNPMYYRPYQTHYDKDVAEDLSRRIDTNAGMAPTSSLMSGIANRILTPSQQHVGQIPIVNNWDMPRARFNLVLELQAANGTVYHYHIQGYSSHFDTSMQGTPDPEMQFFINSYVRLNRHEFYGPNGIEVREVVTESAQVINGRMVKTLQGHDLFGMRPHEIYSVMQGEQITNGIYLGEENQQVRDDRHVISNQSIPSNRTNNLAANMLAKVVEGYQVGQAMAEYGQDSVEIIGRSKDHVYEGTLLENAFFRSLSNITGDPTAVSFKMADLIRIDPNVQHASVSTWLTLDARAMAKLNHTGQSEYWHRPDDRNAWASTVLINAVPSLMMEHMLNKVEFTAHNHDHMGNNHVTFVGAKDLLGRDVAQNLNVFKLRLIREVLHDLSGGNSETFSIRMHVDLYADTVVDIQLGQGPTVRFVAPSFCDSLLVPVITPDENVLRNNAYDISQILNSVASVKQPGRVDNRV